MGQSLCAPSRGWLSHVLGVVLAVAGLAGLHLAGFSLTA